MDTKLVSEPQTATDVPVDEQGISPESRQAGHEKSDVSIQGLFTFGGSLFVFLVGALVVVAVFYEGFHLLTNHLDQGRSRTEPAASSLVVATPDYQGPLMQVKPEEDLRWMREHNAANLNSYGWVDRSKGVVRMPVDRAMALIAERGLPPVSPGKTLEALQRERAQPQVFGQSLRP